MPIRYEGKMKMELAITPLKNKRNRRMKDKRPHSMDEFYWKIKEEPITLTNNKKAHKCVCDKEC